MTWKLEKKIYYCSLLFLSGLSLLRLSGTFEPALNVLLRGDRALWASFLITISGYSMVGLIACLYKKILPVFSRPFLFLFFLFGIFFFEQVYISFKLYHWIQEYFLLRIVLAVLFFGGLDAARRNNIKLFESRFPKFGWMDFLIMAWILGAFFYFLSENFLITRQPYVDESSFWFVQAKDFVALDPLYREGTRYAHSSYGIPFIIAFPQVLFKTSFPQGPYFMPIILIFILGGVLYELRRDRWAFLFFLGLLLMTVNRHLWWQKLFFSLIYGEGLTAVFVLVLISELWWWKERGSKNDTMELTILTFSIGLLFYTKMPSSYVFIAFLSVIFSIKKGKISEKVFLFLLACIPFLIWKLGSPVVNVPGIGGGVVFSFKNFRGMAGYLIKKYTAPMFFSFISFLLVLFSFKKKELWFLFPLISILLFIVLIYASILRNSEFESSGRYIMHFMLGLYFLGAIAFSRLLNYFFDCRFKNFRLGKKYN